MQHAVSNKLPKRPFSVVRRWSAQHIIEVLLECEDLLVRA